MKQTKEGHKGGHRGGHTLLLWLLLPPSNPLLEFAEMMFVCLVEMVEWLKVECSKERERHTRETHRDRQRHIETQTETEKFSRDMDCTQTGS